MMFLLSNQVKNAGLARRTLKEPPEQALRQPHLSRPSSFSDITSEHTQERV